MMPDMNRQHTTLTQHGQLSNIYSNTLQYNKLKINTLNPKNHE